MRNRDHSGVVGRWQSPDSTPDAPGLTQIAIILAIVRDKQTPEVGRSNQLLTVGGIELISVVGRNDIVQTHLEKKMVSRLDISIKIQFSHVNYARTPK